MLGFNQLKSATISKAEHEKIVARWHRAHQADQARLMELTGERDTLLDDNGILRAAADDAKAERDRAVLLAADATIRLHDLLERMSHA